MFEKCFRLLKKKNSNFGIITRVAVPDICSWMRSRAFFFRQRIPNCAGVVDVHRGLFRAGAIVSGHSSSNMPTDRRSANGLIRADARSAIASSILA